VNKFLLDTKVISELRKPRPHGGVAAWLKAQRNEQLLVSAVTVGEIQAGIELTRQQDSSKAKEIEEWLDRIEDSYQIVPMDVACFREWGRLRIRKPASLLEDGLIAATARVHNLIVATRNERDFRQLDVPIVNPFKFV